jgi:REP element-mobilizing transposase RayT
LNPQVAAVTLPLVSNIHRLRVADRIFFVNVNLRRGVPPFTSSEYPLILEALEASRSRLGFALCGYVLMSDHWHALIWPRYPVTISRVLHDVKTTSARKLNRRRGVEGPLWQHQFWDRFVRNAKEFSQRLDYMHQNPVRKGLVSRPEQWPWSSYNNFSLDKDKVRACPIQIDYLRLPEKYRG